MNAIDILNRCRDADGELKRLEERIERYRACATDSAAHISLTGRTKGGSGDPLAAFAVEIGDCERAREKRMREYQAENYCACKLLDRLPETECSILYRYYVSGQTVPGIARALSLTEGYVKRKKASALRMAEAIDAARVHELLPPWYTDEHGGK